jgi:hypothetical protein
MICAARSAVLSVTVGELWPMRRLIVEHVQAGDQVRGVRVPQRLQGGCQVGDCKKNLRHWIGGFRSGSREESFQKRNAFRFSSRHWATCSTVGP